MNGTEKQVSWAEDIKTQVTQGLTERRAGLVERYTKRSIAADDERWQNVTEIDRCLGYLSAQDEAKFWIDNFSGFAKVAKYGVDGAVDSVVEKVNMFIWQANRKGSK